MQINNTEHIALFEIAMIEFIHDLDLVEKLVFLKLWNGATIRQASKQLGFSHVMCQRYLKTIRGKLHDYFDIPEVFR